MEKEYFDARFDGLEKLMESKDQNIKEYVGAVSKNLTALRNELGDHKESSDAHGVGATKSVVPWLALFVAFLAAIGSWVKALAK